MEGGPPPGCGSSSEARGRASATSPVPPWRVGLSDLDPDPTLTIARKFFRMKECVQENITEDLRQACNVVEAKIYYEQRAAVALGPRPPQDPPPAALLAAKVHRGCRGGKRKASLLSATETEAKHQMKFGDMPIPPWKLSPLPPAQGPWVEPAGSGAAGSRAGGLRAPPSEASEESSDQPTLEPPPLAQEIKEEPSGSTPASSRVAALLAWKRARMAPEPPNASTACLTAAAGRSPLSETSRGSSPSGAAPKLPLAKATKEEETSSPRRRRSSRASASSTSSASRSGIPSSWSPP